MKKLTANDKKRITADWQSQFSDFTVYKPMWLMRRAGFFVQGILLERDSTNSNYVPTTHIHNLAVADADSITLTLPAEYRNKKGAVTRIGIERHGEELSEIIKDFETQTPLPLRGNLKYEHLFSAYEKFIKSGAAEVKYPYKEWYDIGCLMVWCAQLEDAIKLAEQYQNVSRAWPESFMKYQGDRVQLRLDWLNRWISNRDDLIGVVQKNEELLKVGKVTETNLVCP